MNIMLIRKKYPAIFSHEAVHAHPVFAGIKPSSMDEIAPFFGERAYEADESFMCGDLFFIVKSGTVRVHEKPDSDLKAEVYELKAGQSAGEHNLVRPEFSVLDCRVLESAGLLVLDSGAFGRLTQKCTRTTNRLYLNLSALICERLERLDREYVRRYFQKLSEEEASRHPHDAPGFS